MASRLPVGRQSAETRFGLACSLGHAYSVLIITHWVLRAPKKDTAHVIRSVMFVAVDNSQSTLYDSLTGPTAPSLLSVVGGQESVTQCNPYISKTTQPFKLPLRGVTL